MRIIKKLGLLALLVTACPCSAAEKPAPDAPVDVTIVLPTENDWKTPVFGRGIDHLMGLTHLHYLVQVAPFARGGILLSQPATCSGFASEEYARLHHSLWIGPVLNLRIVVYAAQMSAQPASIDDLTARRIGVMSDSYLSRWAERHGLKTEPVAIDNLNFSKLELGRIEYWLTYQQTAEAFVKRTQQSLPKLALALDQLQIGMACSANLDPKIIDTLKSAAETYFAARGAAALDLD